MTLDELKIRFSQEVEFVHNCRDAPNSLDPEDNREAWEIRLSHCRHAIAAAQEIVNRLAGNKPKQ